MSYWLACVVIFIASFLLTEIYFRIKHQKVVVVRVKKKDGSEELVEIKPGRDPEVEALLDSLRKKRGLS